MPRIVQTVFRRVYGKPAWLVRKGYGSSITLEFGRPKLKIWKKLLKPSRKAGIKYPTRLASVRGDWRLWIYCCHWEVRQEGEKIGHSESSDKKVEQACSVLDGQILERVIFDSRTLRTEFHFDLGGQLRTSPYRGEPMEMWSLRCPNGRYFEVSSDGTYCYCPGDTKPNEKRWLPLISDSA